jgi:hypothetical protein
LANHTLSGVRFKTNSLDILTSHSKRPMGLEKETADGLLPTASNKVLKVK